MRRNFSACYHFEQRQVIKNHDKVVNDFSELEKRLALLTLLAESDQPIVMKEVFESQVV
jgi:hypothetical protein